METPNILIAQEPKPNQSIKLPKRLLIILAIIIAFATTGYFSLPFLSHYLPFLKIAGITPQVQPKLIKQTTINELPFDSHPNLFSSVLEYDLEKGTAIQLTTNKLKGDQTVLLLNQPIGSENDFIYKTEVLSDKNELLQSGWTLISSDIINKNGNKIVFQITCMYISKATIKIYLPDNRLIWTGKIT